LRATAATATRREPTVAVPLRQCGNTPAGCSELALEPAALPHAARMSAIGSELSSANRIATRVAAG